MSATRIRPGFTLLEMLTASVLLGLLVTLLLSLFNQGEIAWSVGKTTATETGRRSRSLARAAREGAETVFVTKPTPSALRLLPAWEANGEVRTTRPFMRVETGLPEAGQAARPIALEAIGGQSAESVDVVVASAGPDGRWGTEDDLTTAPEEEFE